MKKYCYSKTLWVYIKCDEFNPGIAGKYNVFHGLVSPVIVFIIKVHMYHKGSLRHPAVSVTPLFALLNDLESH